MVSNGLFWKQAKQSVSPGDGHCLLHSIVHSMESQLQPPVKLTVKGLLDSMHLELIHNKEYYLPFTVDHDMSKLLEGFHAYAKDKMYDSSFGDMAPCIIANALQICLIVVIENDADYDVRVINPIMNENDHKMNLSCLFVHKRNAHYNAIIPQTPKKCMFSQSHGNSGS